MFRLASLGLALAACGSAAARPVAPTAGPPAAAPVPATLYAALFKDGATWTYQVTTTSSTNEPGDPKADKDGLVKERATSQVRCTVSEVRTWSAGVLSHVECDGAVGSSSDPLAGVWIADARGLFHSEDLPAAGADPDLKGERIVIAAAPRAGKDEKKGTGDEDGFGESTEVVEKDGAWCVTYASWGGDESYETLCFADGVVVKGGAGWAGGSVHDATFELMK